MKTGKSQIVLGVSRDVLNRALWWFMVALLVTCALADQNSGSLLMGPKYAVARDGRCWGILGKHQGRLPPVHDRKCPANLTWIVNARFVVLP